MLTQIYKILRKLVGKCGEKWSFLPPYSLRIGKKWVAEKSKFC
jgi:hypothetical protein